MFTFLIWLMFSVGVFIRLGLATIIARLWAREIATFNRFLSKRKFEPLGLSLASDVHMLRNTIGASRP
jgi:hypothetical protein